VTLKLASIVESLASDFNARCYGDQNVEIDGLAPLLHATPSQLSFLSGSKYLAQLPLSKAACVIVSPAFEAVARQRGVCVVADDPYHYFARVTQLWKQQHTPKRVAAIHVTASIDPLAKIGKNVAIGAFSVVAAGAQIADGVQIAEHCVIGEGASIGCDTRLAARATLMDGCRIGERCILHPGVVIGADGFGFAAHQGRWEKIEQLGSVHVGNDVEIGANTCIDRGALQDTVIEDGVKLDNLIQIGHNVRIGAHTAMAGCVGVAGSATIGAHCTIGGGAIVLGHLTLADGVHISAASVVTRSILKAGNYTGFFPLDDNATWEKNAVTLKHLHGLRERIKQLEKNL